MAFTTMWMRIKHHHSLEIRIMLAWKKIITLISQSASFLFWLPVKFYPQTQTPTLLLKVYTCIFFKSHITLKNLNCKKLTYIIQLEHTDSKGKHMPYSETVRNLESFSETNSDLTNSTALQKGWKRSIHQQSILYHSNLAYFLSIPPKKSWLEHVKFM